MPCWPAQFLYYKYPSIGSIFCLYDLYYSIRSTNVSHSLILIRFLSYLTNFWGDHSSWGPNFLGTKFPGDQISRGPNFSGTKFLGDQISRGPKRCGDQISGDQISQGPNFLGPKLLGDQISWGPKNSGAQMSSGTNSVTAADCSQDCIIKTQWRKMFTTFLGEPDFTYLCSKL